MASTELSPLPDLAYRATDRVVLPIESANDGLLETYAPRPLYAPEKPRDTLTSGVPAVPSPEPMPAQHFNTFDLYLLHYEGGHVAPAARLDFREAISHDGQAPLFSEPGEYSVKLRRGGHVVLRAPTLSKDRPFTGCSFHLKSMKPAHCEFILVLARATDLVIFNPQGNDTEEFPVLILSKPEQTLQVPHALYSKPALAGTTLHLHALLERSYQLWQQQQRTPLAEESNGWYEQWEQMLSQS